MPLKLWEKILVSEFWDSKWFTRILWAGIFSLVLMVVIINICSPKIHPSGYACCENLQKIDGAKQQWALELKKKDTDVPTWNDLVTVTPGYLKKTPQCPRGGIYTIGSVSADPVCSLGQVKPSWFSWNPPDPQRHRLP